MGLSPNGDEELRLTKEKALLLEYLKEEEDSVRLLIRGLFWPFWPWRGHAEMDGKKIVLKLPGKPLETIPPDRVAEIRFKQLGAAIFVFVDVKAQSIAPVAVEKSLDENDEAAVEEEKQAEEVTEPVMQTRYLGFFNKHPNALRLHAFLEKAGYQTSLDIGKAA